MKTLERRVATVEAMEELGAQLAPVIGGLRLVCLRGALGAGKTTLIRGLVRALGHAGAVKSPTFTLIESYPFDRFTLNHFDLYRLKGPEELEFMGWRDYLQDGSVCLIEWPERAEGVLPMPDIEVKIEISDGERYVQLLAHSRAGEAALDSLC
jgi:tRNA threonylcarbamoyladenosine biosynthesis protein TsaE